MTHGRSWTDEQLIAAVAASRSWRGVARALGLKGTSSATISSLKRHTTRLNLTTTHFSGRRRWSDADLSAAVRNSASWTDVLAALGVAGTSESQVRVRADALRLGLEVTHLAAPAAPSLSDQVRASEYQPTSLRAAGTSLAMAWFTLRGYGVALPVEPQVYDLLVTAQTGVLRVQVKTCSSTTSDAHWLVTVGRRPYRLESSAGRVPYDPDLIDLFFIVLGDGRIYLVPASAIAGRVGINADTYPQYLVGDASGLLR
ncbi:group I intron-associated PD-(D/E)XK endonuclease [Kribbella sp. HUAS MG21]|uniref:Group I intron-associated PD-(D/E)XK endonuclease n=1 Tax=Kribbella sp. HUAS MG21 TaxID=3160966 RepID=A0AAU7T8C7_9ACTN